MKYDKFIEQAFANKEKISDKYYYVCNYVPKTSNLFKKISAHLKPTRIKISEHIDSEILGESKWNDSIYDITRRQVYQYVGDKKLTKRIDTYNLNSGSFIYIFDDKKECVEFYLELRRKHLDAIKEQLNLMERKLEKDESKIKNEINKL